MKGNAVTRGSVSRRFARRMMIVMGGGHVSRDAAFPHYCVVVPMTVPSPVCVVFRGSVSPLVVAKVMLIVGPVSPVSRGRVSNCPSLTASLTQNARHPKSVSLVFVCPPRGASMIENVL